MPGCLRPCVACDRHVKNAERVCPFCGATLEPVAGVTTSRATRGLTRAALVFTGAAAVASCSSSSSSVTALYGGPPVVEPDAGDASPDASRDASPVALYGVAPVRDL
jgi:hypothetical protein